MSLRSLSAIAHAARSQGLAITPTLMPEVLLECPQCKAAGHHAKASITIQHGAPHVRCNACERWDDDPHQTLSILGHDPDHGDEHEIALRVFELLWAIHRAASDLPERVGRLGPPSRRPNAGKANLPQRGDPMAPQSITPTHNGVLKAP